MRRGGVGAHEADPGQRAGRGGEGEGAVEAAGPDGAAEGGGGPQAGAAEDRGGRVGGGAGAGWPGGAWICHWRVPEVRRATAELAPASLGGLIAGAR